MILFHILTFICKSLFLLGSFQCMLSVLLYCTCNITVFLNTGFP